MSGQLASRVENIGGDNVSGEMKQYVEQLSD